MWAFNERSLGRTREPVTSAFFTHDPLSRELVCEVGQNSHDASAGSGGPVLIRYTLCDALKALSAAQATAYFSSLEEHLAASGAGFVPDAVERCPHLVIEDFGTIGLTGDVHAMDPPTDLEEKNHFFNFFRAENISGKSGGDGGRWGVGKVVYKMASRIDTYFAYTIRAGDAPERALMGVSILKNHMIDSRRFEPDGWYGEHSENGFHLPIADPGAIDEFVASWNVSRVSEPGLSVVIPYPDPTLDLNTLRAYAIRDFFMPVMKGELVFEFVDEGGLTCRVSKETLEEEASKLIAAGYGRVDDDESPGLEEIARFIDMLEPTMAMNAMADVESKTIQSSTQASDMFDQDSINGVREKLDLGETVNIKVNLNVNKQGVGPRDSFFNVIIRKEEGLTVAPLFIRGKLVVTKAKRTPINGYRCIVNTQHSLLSSFLGDAENPAHEEWLPNTEGLNEKYVGVMSLLRLVKNAPWRILAAIRQLDENETRPVLPSFFSVFDPESVRNSGTKGSGRRRGGKQPPLLPSGQEPREPAFTEEYAVADGGFGVRLTPSGINHGVRKVRVQIAYARFDGRALQSWEPEDFDVANLPLSVEGGLIETRKGKEVVALVEEPKRFDLRVGGFDANRDLHVESRGSV